MDAAELAEFIRKAVAAGVATENLLRFLDAFELKAEFMARAGPVAPNRPDYAD
jgi:hypothetical protein